MNIMVTGANGQLGNEMQIVSKASSKDKYIFTDVCDGYTHLDITNIDAIRQMVKDNDVKCIINCAAWTNVDKAETAGEIVETLNATAPENLAKVMKEVEGLLVHISTDYVFGHAARIRRERQQASMALPSCMASKRFRLPASTTSFCAPPGSTQSSVTTS